MARASRSCRMACRRSCGRNRGSLLVSGWIWVNWGFFTGAEHHMFETINHSFPAKKRQGQQDPQSDDGWGMMILSLATLTFTWCGHSFPQPRDVLVKWHSASSSACARDRQGSGSGFVNDLQPPWLDQSDLFLQMIKWFLDSHCLGPARQTAIDTASRRTWKDTCGQGWPLKVSKRPTGEILWWWYQCHQSKKVDVKIIRCWWPLPRTSVCFPAISSCISRCWLDYIRYPASFVSIKPLLLLAAFTFCVCS